LLLVACGLPPAAANTGLASRKNLLSQRVAWPFRAAAV